jgi:antitoxin CptB
MNEERPDDDAVGTRRLWWRSRRGLRELDLLLLPFVEDQYTSLDAHWKDVYLRLLEEEDTELLAWFTGRALPLDGDMAELVERIRATRRPVS